MTPTEKSLVVSTVQGLLAIAKIAMPDTYYAIDSRVKKAQQLLTQLRKVSQS
jgi:hypothetical protein